MIHGCGCYDGTFAPDDPTDVSIRCDAHAHDPGYREGAQPMTVDEAQIALTVAARRGLEAGWLKPKLKAKDKPMAVPKSRVRR